MATTYQDIAQRDLTPKPHKSQLTDKLYEKFDAANVKYQLGAAKAEAFDLEVKIKELTEKISEIKNILDSDYDSFSRIDMTANDKLLLIEHAEKLSQEANSTRDKISEVYTKILFNPDKMLEKLQSEIETTNKKLDKGINSHRFHVPQELLERKDKVDNVLDEVGKLATKNDAIPRIDFAKDFSLHKKAANRGLGFFQKLTRLINKAFGSSKQESKKINKLLNSKKLDNPMFNPLSTSVTSSDSSVSAANTARKIAGAHAHKDRDEKQSFEAKTVRRLK